MNKLHLNLAAVMAVAVTVIGGQIAADPAELQQLRQTYQQRVEAATKPLTQDYVRELEKLKKRFENRQEYEKAGSVSEEIAHVSSPPVQPTKEIALPAKEATLKGSLSYQQNWNDTVGNWTRPDEEIRWQVENIEPGSYEVSIQYACDNKAGGEFTLTVGDAVLKGTAKPTGSDAITKKVLGRVDLQGPGTEVVLKGTLRRGDFFMNVRGVILRPVKRP